MLFSSDYRSTARAALSGYWGTSILVALVAGLLGADGNAFSSAGSSSSDSSSTVASMDSVPPVVLGIIVALFSLLVIYALVTLIIGGAMKLGLVSYNMDLITRRNPPVFSTLFSRFNIFGKAFALNFMMNLFITLWTLLLIVPGIIAMYRYVLAPYLMAENPNLGVMEAIRLSKQMMVGNKWRLFKLYISFIGWILLGVLTLGIGYLWLNPYMHAAEAAFCLDIMRNNVQQPYQEAPEM